MDYKNTKKVGTSKFYLLSIAMNKNIEIEILIHKIVIKKIFFSTIKTKFSVFIYSNLCIFLCRKKLIYISNNIRNIKMSNLLKSSPVLLQFILFLVNIHEKSLFHEVRTASRYTFSWLLMNNVQLLSTISENFNNGQNFSTNSQNLSTYGQNF